MFKKRDLGGLKRRDSSPVGQELRTIPSPGRAATQASVSRSVLKCAAQRLCRRAQFLVARPEFRSFSQRYRREEMNIDIPDALAVQGVARDETQNFFALGNRRRRQVLKQLQDRQPIAQTSAGDLADHERMHDDLRSFKQINKLRIAAAQVIDPD